MTATRKTREECWEAFTDAVAQVVVNIAERKAQAAEVIEFPGYPTEVEAVAA